MRMMVVIALLFALGCSSTTPNRDPVGEVFPTVRGGTLAGDEVRLPDHALEAKTPAVLIVAYVQDAQFDVDRWLLGILDSGLEASVYEVPTVEGILPGLVADRIDEGFDDREKGTRRQGGRFIGERIDDRRFHRVGIY